MRDDTIPLTWGQAAMVEMFARRGFRADDWPQAAMLAPPTSGSSHSAVEQGLRSLVVRHEMLRADFEPTNELLDLADPTTFPRQRIASWSLDRPMEIERTPDDPPVDEAVLGELATPEFLRRGRGVLPVMVRERGQWRGGLVSSYLALDGASLIALEQEFGARSAGAGTARRLCSIREVLELEASPASEAAEADDLARLRGMLCEAPDIILRNDASYRDPDFASLDSSSHARVMEELSRRCAASKPSVSLVAYAALIGAELDMRQVLVRSMFRRPSPVAGAELIAPDSPFVTIAVDVDAELPFGQVVRRAAGSIISGYRAASYSPFGHERARREVAATRGLPEIDGIPEFNHLQRSSSSRLLHAADVHRTSSVDAAGFVPYTRGGLSIIEESDHDVIRLFGTHWPVAGDSSTFLKHLTRFCALALAEPERSVRSVIDLARDTEG